MKKLEHFPQMVAGVMGNNPSTQTECTTQSRRLLDDRNTLIQKVIDANVVAHFVEFLSEQGVVPFFVVLLSNPNDDVREQAVWALGNIAGHSILCRDLVLESGAMEPLLRQLQTQGKLSMMRKASWTLSKLCEGKPQPNFDRVRIALPTLAELICHHDEEVLINSCSALLYLADGPNEKIQAVIEAGVCRRLVELLMNPSPAVQAPALRTVGNIVTGNDEQTQFIINQNALPCLLALLGSPKKVIQKDACWTISNITAGTSEQIQSVIDAGIVPQLLEMLVDTDLDLRKEAVWAISNATSGGTPLQINFLVAQGCIKPLCDLLSVTDPKIVTKALEGLENILKKGDADAKATGAQNEMATNISKAGGEKRIEDLQHRSNHEIYEKCIKILETYF